jgi:mannose-6-phosphate isomerase-like protein (cupin superfamily)
MIRRAADMRVQVREDMRGGTGPVTIRHYFEKEEFGAQTRLCAHLTLPPGVGIGTHGHEKEDEIFIILRGTGQLDEGSGETRVGPGDAILTGKGGAHSIRNDGSEDLEIVAVIMCYAS